MHKGTCNIALLIGGEAVSGVLMGETSPKLPKGFHTTGLVVNKLVWPVSIEGETIDIATITKILRYLASVKEATITDITKNAHISYSTARAYIPFLAERGLIKVRTEGKKKIVSITEKGFNFLLAVSRVYAMLGIEF